MISWAKQIEKKLKSPHYKMNYSLKIDYINIYIYNCRSERGTFMFTVLDTNLWDQEGTLQHQNGD